LAALSLAAAGYALDRYFFDGLIASKWIGLPQYEPAMRKLIFESHLWGIAAIALNCVAFSLALSTWTKPHTTQILDSSSDDAGLQRSLPGSIILCAGFCILATFGFAVLIPTVAFAATAIIHSI
jgi:hypothetical protein